MRRAADEIKAVKANGLHALSHVLNFPKGNKESCAHAQATLSQILLLFAKLSLNQECKIVPRCFGQPGTSFVCSRIAVTFPSYYNYGTSMWKIPRSFDASDFHHT